MSARARATAALEAVIDETRSLFHHLKRAAEDAHAPSGLSAGQRGILMGLDRHGPQTVPQMARARPVSRQHIQTLVNPLLEQGLVELKDNPDHKRSKLVRLTNKGGTSVDEIKRREAVIFAALVAHLDPGELERAAAALKQVRRAFQGERWERAKRQLENLDTPSTKSRNDEP